MEGPSNFGKRAVFYVESQCSSFLLKEIAGAIGQTKSGRGLWIIAQDEFSQKWKRVAGEIAVSFNVNECPALRYVPFHYDTLYDGALYINFKGLL